MKNIKTTAEEAQNKLNQLSNGEKSINQIRQEMGLNVANDAGFDKLLTRAANIKKGEKTQ